MSEEKVEFVEFLATFNTGDIAFIKSVLEANDIIYYIEGENFLQVRPLAVPAIIKVDKIQYEDAKLLLKDFKSGTFGYNFDP